MLEAACNLIYEIRNKLSHCGIRDIANCWFSSYLSNRKQLVTINGFDSEIESFQYGVPQWSILGPLFLNIYQLSSGSILQKSTKNYEFCVF